MSACSIALVEQKLLHVAEVVACGRSCCVWQKLLHVAEVVQALKMVLLQDPRQLC